MAGTSLLALIDDIATILDDVSLMTKMAAKKTTGVLGDDLALNAQQVSGVNADRELPVVWAVAKGSFVNKLILVPAALLISAFLPWLITPLLMIGGAYLCFEGCEKLLHKFLHPREKHNKEQQTSQANHAENIDMAALEKSKIKGAIRTDFILSAEIIVISLGAVQAASFGVQVAAICAIAVLMTVGVYGLVAGIVKLDDAGLYLLNTAENRPSAAARIALGKAILSFAPWLMKTLSVVGTAAMFLVGGGILVHGLPGSHAWLHHLQDMAGMLAWLVPLVVNLLGGIIAGSLVLAAVMGAAKLRG